MVSIVIYEIADMKLLYVIVVILFTSNTILANTINLCRKDDCYHIDPTTLKVDFTSLSQNIPISVAQQQKEFNIISQNKQELDFDREGFNIVFKINDNALNVTFTNNEKITRTENRTIKFPIIQKSDSFLLPMLEGRFIPTTDSKWIDYLTSTSSQKDPLTGLSSLSMQFLTAGFGDISIYYRINELMVKMGV